jgi:trans-2,3-dihydro-3-hydroxyanthranilate isomerase
MIRAYKVDAFTWRNEGGSPTGVVLDGGGLTEAQMQWITNQIGCSHTAFITEPLDPSLPLTIDFFTAGGKIRNCGHGTIAAHFVRTVAGTSASGGKLFQQVSGELQEVEVMSDHGEVEIFLKLNEVHFIPVAAEVTDELISCLKVDEVEIDKTYPTIHASPASNRFLLALKSTEVLNKVQPDFIRLKELCNRYSSIGCFIYSIENSEQQKATARMFAPNIGVSEDIINGNSSGCLGAYLLQLSGENDLQLQVTQGQQFNRTGIVKVKVRKEHGGIATFIGGNARIAEEIEIKLPQVK